MRKLIVSFIILASLALPSRALAQESVCTTVYGGGVVCGAKTYEHKTVNTGIEKYPFLVASLFLMGSAFALYRISKKIAL